MAIFTTCPNCRATLQFDDSQANQQGSCPGCGATFVIQQGNAGQPSGSMPGGYGQADSGPQSFGPGNPYAAGRAPSGYGYGYGTGGHYAPHRGGVVLALGILGFMVCFILGIVAWTMGSNDLNAMRSGRMDPSGMGLTQAGMICGMISTILGALGTVIFLIAVAANAAF